MKTINFTAKVTFMSPKGKQVELNTHASSSEELFKNLKKVLDSKEKFSVLKLFGLD